MRVGDGNSKLLHDLTLSMLRRVHSIWNHVARAIYLEFTKDISGTQTSEDENSWRFAFHRERLRAGDRISRLRAPTEPSTTLSMSNILDELRTYPATLNTQIEAIKNTSMVDIPNQAGKL